MRISDWSSDVCSSDLAGGDPLPFRGGAGRAVAGADRRRRVVDGGFAFGAAAGGAAGRAGPDIGRARSASGARDERRSRRYRQARRALAELRAAADAGGDSSEEHTSELQSLMRISLAPFYVQKKK